jgi:hypothetical protein
MIPPTPPSVPAFDPDQAFREALTTHPRVRQQVKLCLSCTAVWIQGNAFWCNAHPDGWMDGVPEQRFCPDWQEQ